MQFSVIDSRNKSVKFNPRDFYINGEGKLFYDCDPNGIDMSGKRRIVAVDPELMKVESHLERIERKLDEIIDRLPHRHYGELGPG